MRYYIVEDTEQGTFVQTETVGAIPWAPDEDDEKIRESSRDYAQGSFDSRMLTREELEATPEGRRALQAWDGKDDSVHGAHDAANQADYREIAKRDAAEGRV